MKDSNYEAAEEWRGLNNYEKEVMYDGSGDADDVFLFAWASCSGSWADAFAWTCHITKDKELEEKLSRISEKQNETTREITQQAQDDKMAQKSSENPEKETPEKLIDAVLTEVFSWKLDNFISVCYNRSCNKSVTIVTIMNKTQQRCNII